MSSSDTTLVLVGSASIHTWRYLTGIAPHVDKILLISNNDVPAEYRPANLTATLTVDFSIRAWRRTPGMIRRWLLEQCPWIHPIQTPALSHNTSDKPLHTILHIHQANSIAWHTWRGTTGLPLKRVLTCWGSDILLLPQRGALWRRMVTWNLTQADWITSDSLYMAAEAQRLLAPEEKHISVLNFGIDTLPAPPSTEGRPLRVLSCRLHKPLYRINAILRAWAQIEADCTPWQLTIAASGEQTDALKALAAQLQLQRVEFTGFVDAPTLAALYRDSRVFVSVPESDATSISLLEALGHGCLPVLSNLPANLEWVLNGMNGLITESTTPRVLADTLRQALHLAQDPKRMDEISTFNRNMVEQKGLKETSMQAFANIYRQLQTGTPERNTREIL